MVFYSFCRVFVLLAIGHVIGGQELSPLVSVESGVVQGEVKSTPEGRQFYSYRGIPYAKPPINELRFAAPLSAEAWSGVLQATSDPPLCIQPAEGAIYGTEDCLFLNVFTPKLPDNTSNPSMAVHVFIHGGSFYVEGITYLNLNPERYMNIDMVVVTLNYRLGALGFLSTDDEAASGNFGLLDQNLALQWVQKNIAAFGGNPSDVTLSGQSAGSASVIYHYLSPMSAGLFHRAIAESGSALNPWALQENPVYFSTAMGELFNCSAEDSAQLIDCLRQQTPEDIIKYMVVLMARNLTLAFVPNVETSSSGRFLTQDPLTMLETGNFNKVPLQLGFNRDEGDMIFKYVYFLFENMTEREDFVFDVVTPVLVHVVSDFHKNLINVSYAIKDFYYAGVDYENQTEVNIVTIKWMSDSLMKSGICQTASLVSSHAVPTYLYAYNYVSSHSFQNFTGEPDVMHHTELQYLWYRPLNSTKDIEFGQRFFNLWVEFIMNGTHEAKGGSDDQWLTTPTGQYNYYEFNERFTMWANYDTPHMDFWWDTVPAIVNA